MVVKLLAAQNTPRKVSFFKARIEPDRIFDSYFSKGTIHFKDMTLCSQLIERKDLSCGWLHFRSFVDLFLPYLAMV